MRDFCQLREATFSFGWNKCKGKDGKWKIPNFETILSPHQLVGVRWMLGRALHPFGPKEGFLADDMGLGKTAYVLACMSQNLPCRNTEVSKTLVVAPLRLLCHWFDEIHKHCSDREMETVFIR